MARDIMKFKIGQKIVCIKKGKWKRVTISINTNPKDPKYNEIVTVEQYDTPYNGKNYIILVEYGYYTSHYEGNFAPILDNLNEIKEILKEPIEIYST